MLRRFGSAVYRRARDADDEYVPSCRGTGKNLGVPRLKEIINIAKKIKTPSLTIFFDEGIRYDEKYLKENMTKKLEYTVLKQIVSETQIVFDPNPSVPPYTCIEEDQEDFLGRHLCDHGSCPSVGRRLVPLGAAYRHLDAKGGREGITTNEEIKRALSAI